MVPVTACHARGRPGLRSSWRAGCARDRTMTTMIWITYRCTSCAYMRTTTPTPAGGPETEPCKLCGATAELIAESRAVAAMAEP